MKQYIFALLLCVNQLNNYGVQALNYQSDITHTKNGFLNWMENSKTNYMNDYNNYIYEITNMFIFENVNSPEVDNNELIINKSNLNKKFVKFHDKYINIFLNKVIDLHSDPNSFVYKNEDNDIIIIKFQELLENYNTKIYKNSKFRNIFIIDDDDVDYNSLITKEGLFSNKLIEEYGLVSNNILYDSNFGYYTDIFNEISFKMIDYMKIYNKQPQNNTRTEL